MIGKLFKGIVEGAAAPVAAVLEKREETKQVKAELANKLDISEHKLDMLRTEKTDKTWRDEYVTVWVTVGVSVLSYFVFVAAGVQGVIDFLNVPIVKWSVGAVVVAALGVKGIRSVLPK